MSRLGAAILFAALYVLALVVVAELNASYIIRDAVVGPVVVAVFYAGILAPAAIAAIGTIVLARMRNETRFAVAILFPLLIGVAVELLFVAAQSSSYAHTVRRADLALIAGMNVLFVLLFITFGVVVDRRGRRITAS